MAVSGCDPPGAVAALPRSGRVCAWLLSCAIHLTVFLALAVSLPRASDQLFREPDRPVAIQARAVRPIRRERLMFPAPTAAAETRRAADAAAGLPAVPTHSESGFFELALPRDEGQALAPLRLAAPVGSRATRPRLPVTADYGEWLAREAAEAAATRPQGDPVEVSLFDGAPSLGRSFVFLLDRSRSMGGGGLDALAVAARELDQALAVLQPQHRFTVVAYHHQVVYLDGWRLIPASDRNKRRIAGFVGGLVAYGQTEHELGLRAALRLEPDVIYLFTDGGDPRLTDIQLGHLRRLAASQNTTIHCIQFGWGPQAEADSFLVRLANQNGGGHTYVDLSQERATSAPDSAKLPDSTSRN